jgi:dihydrofolate synthase/folylpolyglutamate synthase
VATVIASISLDHTRQLGNTLAEIAMEKAGIIKPGVPLLCGQLDSEPRQVIATVARQQGCRRIAAGEDFRCDYRPPWSLLPGDRHGGLSFTGDFTGESLQLCDVPLRLLGKHQAENAALALATACELRHQGWSIPVEAMKQGLAEVTLPARIEVIGSQAAVVLDVAHNVASVQALVRTLESIITGSLERPCESILVLAVSRDKDVRGMLRVLLPHFSVVIATEYHDNPRAVPALELARLIRQQQLRGKPGGAALSSMPGSSVPRSSSPSMVLVEPRPVAAWERARQLAQSGQLICVTGSFFIAAELREHLLQASSSVDSVSV